MTPKSFHALIARLGDRADMPFPIHPHMLRHACGFALANAGRADSGPTLISIEIWPDAASAENAMRSGLITWENDPKQPDAPIVY